MTTGRNRPAMLATSRAVRKVSDEETAKTTSATRPAQLFDIDGHRLLLRRSSIAGAPRLASPSWYRLAAAERWRHDHSLTRTF